MSLSTRALDFGARLTATLVPRSLERSPKNPVFFIGSGRSGTNLLAHLLASHPDIAVYPYEANDLWHPGAFPWWASSRPAPPIWKDPYAFTATTLETRTPEEDGRLKATLGAYQALVRGRCVVNKSVMITFMIPHVLTVFPDARFIHLLRDGRAVAVSFARLERARIDRHPERYREYGLDLSFESLVGEFARHWREHVAEIAAQRSDLGLGSVTRLIELRYEDLTNEPDSSLAGLAQFLDVDDEGFNKRQWPRIENRNYKFREVLDKEALMRISAIMEPELSQNGYTDSSDEVRRVQLRA